MYSGGNNIETLELWSSHTDNSRNCWININDFSSFCVLLIVHILHVNILQPMSKKTRKPKAYITLFRITYRKTSESLDILSIDGRLQSLMGVFKLKHVGFVKFVLSSGSSPFHLHIFVCICVSVCKWMDNVLHKF